MLKDILTGGGGSDGSGISLRRKSFNKQGSGDGAGDTPNRGTPPAAQRLLSVPGASGERRHSSSVPTMAPGGTNDDGDTQGSSEGRAELALQMWT